MQTCRVFAQTVTYTEENANLDDCYNGQGIMLLYSDQLLLKENKSDNVDKKHTTTVTVQKLSAYHDNSKCYTHNRGLINGVI